MTITVCEQCGKAGLLQCGHPDVLDDTLYDLSERLRRRAELLEADCRIYDADDIIGVADKLRALSPSSGEPASVAGEAAEDMLRTAKELRDNSNGNPGAIREAIIREVKAAALPKPTPVEAGALDWLRVAKLAGQFGIRYRTNTALEQFLAALSETLPVEREV